MLFALCTFFALAVTFPFFYFKWKRRRLVKMMEQFNGPPVYPLFGNSLDFMRSSKDLLLRLLELQAQYKSPWRIWMFHKPYIVLTNPADIQTVAHKTLEKDSYIYNFMTEAFGDGLMTSRVEKWKVHRQLLNSAFNPRLLSGYFLQIFNKHNDELVKRLSSNIGSDQHFDLWSYISITAVNTFGETTMGLEGTYSDCTIEEYGEALMKSCIIVSQRVYRPLLQPSFIFSIYKRLMGYDRIFKIVRDYPLKMLEQKRRKLLEEKANLVQPDDERGGETIKNFIHILLNFFGKSALSDEEICDQVVTIMLAGSETSAVTTCFVLLTLAMRPEIQDKVYEEIYQVFGNSTRHPTSQDLDELHFLEICINETLRRFPLAPLIFRHAPEDIPISDDYVIPAGSNVILGIAGVHYDPTIYPNPEEWNPSNFEPQNVEKRPAGSFIPFSVGPRGCIGQKYAYVAMKAQLSTILRNYEFSTDVKMDDVELDIDLIVRSYHGYKVKIERRREKSVR